MLSNYI
jgi:hypothetical protein